MCETFRPCNREGDGSSLGVEALPSPPPFLRTTTQRCGVVNRPGELSVEFAPDASRHPPADFEGALQKRSHPACRTDSTDQDPIDPSVCPRR